MLRTVLLVTLNLLLPWLVYLLWRLARQRWPRGQGPQVRDVTPRHPWPWPRLLLAGLLLLAFSLALLRWQENPTQPTTWQQANPAQDWHTP